MFQTVRNARMMLASFKKHNAPVQVSRSLRPLSTTGRRSASRYVRFGVDSKQPLNIQKWDSRTKLVAGIVVAGGVYYVAHVEKIEETGRWRFMDVGPRLEAKLAKASHDEFVAEFGGKVLPPNHPVTRHVRRIVERMLEASNLGTLAPSQPGHTLPFDPDSNPWVPVEHSSDVPPTVGGRQWNLLVVNDDNIVNAAAAFGDIIVFTGILPVAKDEEGLAAVLSHEIGHAVLRHMSEKTSSVKILLVLVGTLAILGLDLGLSHLVSRLVYDLPNSRMHELEADKVGLKLMARACYDPHAASDVFRRLARLEGSSGRLVQFLDTHPPTKQRIERLEQMLPDAYAIRAASPECAGLSDQLSSFRDAFQG